MATHYIPIRGAATLPDTSGSVFGESYAVKATNDLWPYLIHVFNDTATRLGLLGNFLVPNNYVGSAGIYVVWSTTATSGDVEWDVDYRAIGGDDLESLDQATAQESVNSNDTAPSAAQERMNITLSLTSANLAALDVVQFGLFRDGTDGGDTIAAAIQLHGLYFTYADA